MDIIVSFPSGGQARGSGTLLPTGQDVLTAAHIFFDAGGNFANGAAVFVTTPGGTQPLTTFVPDIHPSYNGTITSPGDLAVIRTTPPASTAADRFDIYRNTDEIGQQFEKSGYGRSGTGAQGSILASGQKRDGGNKFDAAAEALNGTVYVAGTFPSGAQLLFDFDNGSSANDAVGVGLGLFDVGLGSDEVSTAPGDSGGPALIGNLIAGVTSFGVSPPSTVGTDVLPGTNSSFGEFAFDTRVSTYAPWIDSVIDVAGAPGVTNVTISGSASTHDPFSFNDPADDANDFDGSGIQLRTVPVGGADTVSIELSEHVLGIGGSSLTLTGLTTGTVPQLAVGGFSYDVGTHVAQWTFDAPFDADQYLLSLSDSVTDVASNALDGEWTNPFSVTTTNAAVSEFPSGNGTAGGDFNFVFTILPGDGNLDNSVGGSDFLLWQRNIGGPGHTFTQADYDGNGNTDSADNAFWQTNYGTNLRDLVFADFNGDGVVNSLDEGIANTNQGIGTTHAQGDADNDGDVDSTDLAIAQMQFGLELDWVA